MAVKVGSFTKSTAAATASQAVTGLGFLPKVLLLWTAAATADGFSDGYHYAFGATTGAAESYSVGSAAVDNAADTNTSKRHAAKALTIIEWGESLLAECDLTSFDADGFTLSWTTNNASAYIIHYMALGGADLTNAKAITWVSNTSTGNQGVTGVGFQPDCVLHFTMFSSAAVPTSAAGGTESLLGIGIMDGTLQWVNSVYSRDGRAAGSAQRVSDDSICSGGNSSTSTSNYRFSFGSMDADGFTVNKAQSGNDAKYFSLCLKGGDYHVGVITKSNSTDVPVAQAVTGVGFLPEGVLMLGQKRNSKGTTGIQGIYQAVGASDGTNNHSVFGIDQEGADPTNTAVRDSVSVMYSEADAGQTVSCEGTISSLGADGFTVTWTTNDAAANYLYYFAFAGGSAATATIAPKMMYYKRLRQ